MNIRIVAAIVGLGVSTGLNTTPTSLPRLAKVEPTSEEEAPQFELNKSAFDISAEIGPPLSLELAEVPIGATRTKPSNASPTPEPATMAALALGGAMMLVRKRRKKDR